MKPGYGHATIKNNIAQLKREGYTPAQAAAMALSLARAQWFKRFPQGLLPEWLAFHGMRRKSDYTVEGKPVGRSVAYQHNPVRALDIGVRERERIQREVNDMFSDSGYTVRRAAKLYANFSGHEDVKIQKVMVRDKIPGLGRVALVFGHLDFLTVEGRTFKFTRRESPLVCAAPDGKRLFLIGGEFAFPEKGTLGKLENIGYSTVRDGVAEKYIHRFKASSRPLLKASTDGKQLSLLGGAYDFTDRGIVDR